MLVLPLWRKITIQLRPLNPNSFLAVALCLQAGSLLVRVRVRTRLLVRGP